MSSTNCGFIDPAKWAQSRRTGWASLRVRTCSRHWVSDYDREEAIAFAVEVHRPLAVEAYRASVDNGQGSAARLPYRCEKNANTSDRKVAVSASRSGASTKIWSGTDAEHRGMLTHTRRVPRRHVAERHRASSAYFRPVYKRRPQESNLGRIWRACSVDETWRESSSNTTSYHQQLS